MYNILFRYTLQINMQYTILFSILFFILFYILFYVLVISYKLIDVIIYFVDFSKRTEMEDTVDEGPECTDYAEAAEPVTKKKKLTNMSMLSFLTEAPKARKIQIENTSNQFANKRDYSKNKHVCMLCVNDDNLKDKKIAILCRGTVHQL